MDKYGCHIANMSHTAIIQNGHIDPTFLHTCAKTQIKLQHETTISVFASYELTANNSLNRNTSRHKFHIIGISPKQICMPHYIYIYILLHY